MQRERSAMGVRRREEGEGGRVVRRQEVRDI